MLNPPRHIPNFLTGSQFFNCWLQSDLIFFTTAQPQSHHQLLGTTLSQPPQILGSVAISSWVLPSWPHPGKGIGRKEKIDFVILIKLALFFTLTRYIYFVVRQMALKNNLETKNLGGISYYPTLPKIVLIWWYVCFSIKT